MSQKHLLNRRITKSPPFVRAPSQSPGIDFAILNEIRDRFAKRVSLGRQAPEGVREAPLTFGR